MESTPAKYEGSLETPKSCVLPRLKWKESYQIKNLFASGCAVTALLGLTDDKDYSINIDLSREFRCFPAPSGK